MTSLTMKNEKRLEIIQRVYRSELPAVEAAVITGIGERQCYGIKARIKQEVSTGVVNGNRERSSQHKIEEKTVERITELARWKYQDLTIAGVNPPAAKWLRLLDDFRIGDAVH